MKDQELLDSFETVDRKYRFFKLESFRRAGRATWNISYTIKKTGYVNGFTFNLKRDAQATWKDIREVMADRILNTEFDNLVFRG